MVRQNAQPRPPWRATGKEPPVFFDARGHRGRAVRVFGGLSGLLSAGGLALIVTGGIGFTSVPDLHLRTLHPTGAQVSHSGESRLASHRDVTGRALARSYRPADLRPGVVLKRQLRAAAKPV